MSFQTTQAPPKIIDKDYLTGLASRRGLHDYYDTLDKSSMIHAMFIDIDNFKKVNDVYGHTMGDKLLIGIANLIRSIVPGFISRIGGDEYVILLDSSITREEACTFAQKMISGMPQISYRKDVLSLISLSVGIVLDQQVGQPIDDVLSKCDAAMYQAKNAGKNRYTVYTSSDKALEINRIIEREMKGALAKGEFEVYLQPKVNMVTQELYGAEALSRWVHPVDGVREPSMYIPLFEKNSFISTLDMYIFEKVCQIKASWEDKPYYHIPISVNMSRLHLYDPNFPDTLKSIADKYYIPASELEIEIKESIFFKDPAELINTVEHLRWLGFMVSVDNFGSGFSALNLLKDLMVDTIKLDRRFLQVCANTTRGRLVISNIISLCRDLETDIVTEGIETKEQSDFIISCGCPIAQGFYYAKPLPIYEFIDFAQEHTNCLRLSHTFHFNGSLLSENGSLTASPHGDDLAFTNGIFKDSKAVHFPGGTAECNTLQIPADAISNDSYTVSMWIKPSSPDAWSSALYIRFETGFVSLVPLASNGQSDFHIRDPKEINVWHDVTANAIPVQTWTHYVASYDETTETASVYINGELVGSLSGIPTNRFADSIILGGDIYHDSFRGDICEFVIYNEVKDAKDISELYQSYIQHDDFIGNC